MTGFFGAGGMGGNVERHIGDDDRDGAAIEAIRAALAMAARLCNPPDQSEASRLTEFAAGCRHTMIRLEAAIRAIDPAEVMEKVETTPAPDAVARLVEAARALGAMPEGYCFCSANRVGDDSKIHEPECADLRATLVAKENEQCQVSIGPAIGATINGLHGSGAGAPDAIDNSYTDDLIDLIGEFGREVYYLLDDCETSGPVGEEIHTITEDGLRKVSAILDRIDALPFGEPGVMLGTGAMLQAAIMQTFAHPPRTGGRRQMKVLIVGGPNRGQVVDIEVTPASVLELVEVCDRVRGESFWFKVEADVQDKHEYVMRELCRAYEYLMKGETHRQHVKKNGKL